MSAMNKQGILENAHSIMVEYCLLKGQSHDKLMNAITRDIYSKQNAKETDEFHQNIQKCATNRHHKLSQDIHIAHFSQLKWMSTLTIRPNAMLPTAHHLIIFFNHINIPGIDINNTQSIREELIVQCLLSMDCIDSLHLQRYCFPFDFCPNYKSLNALIGKEKTSNVYKEFSSQHPWKEFAKNLNKWCMDVLNALKLTPNKSFLCRLSRKLNKKQNKNTNKSKKEENKENHQINVIEINDSNESEQDVGGKYVSTEVVPQNVDQNDVIDDDIEMKESVEAADAQADVGGRYIAKRTVPQNDDDGKENQNENEVAQNEVNNDSISQISQNHVDAKEQPIDDGLQLMQLSGGSTIPETDSNDANEEENENNEDQEPTVSNEIIQIENDQASSSENAEIESNEKLPSSMPSLEPGSQMVEAHIEHVASTQEDDFEEDNEEKDALEASPIFVQSQCTNNTQKETQSQLGFHLTQASQASQLSNHQISDTESPPDANVVVASQSQTEFLSDYLSQNKPPSQIQCTPNQLSGNSDLSTPPSYEPSQNKVRKPHKKRSFDEMDQDSPVKKAKIENNKSWPTWMKKGIEITLDLDEELCIGIVRLMKSKFILVKLDEDAPNKYKSKQIRIYLKDAGKYNMEKIDDCVDDKEEEDENADEQMLSNESENPNDTEQIPLRNEQNEEETNENVEQDDFENEPRGILKDKGQNGRNHNSVSFNFTLSQETRQQEIEQNGGASKPKRSKYNFKKKPNSNNNRAKQQKKVSTYRKQTSSLDSVSTEERGFVFMSDKSKENMKQTASTYKVMPDHLINDESTSNEETNAQKQKKRKMIRQRLGGDVMHSSKKRKFNTRTPWTDDEIEAVIEGYEKYQQHENAPIGKPGIWAYTLRDPKLNKILCRNNRKGHNLKDKWRHLVATNDERIQHLLTHSQREEGNKNKNKSSPTRAKMPKLPTRPIR